MSVKSLVNQAVRFRLLDSSIGNEELAAYLKLDNMDQDFMGFPSSCFYKHGVIAGIRVSDEEMAIFYLFQHARNLMDKIAVRIQKEVHA